MKIAHTPRSDRATTRKPETAPPRIATWTASTRLRRAADAVRTLALTATNMPMIPDAIEHSAPTKKAKAVMSPIGRPAMDGTSATSGVSTTVISAPIDDRADHGEDEDRRVLALDEGDCAFEDRPGDVLHLLGPRVASQDIAGQVDRKQDGDDACRQDDQLERTGIHQVRRSSTLGLLTRCRPRLVACATRDGRTGECCLWSRRHAPAAGTLQAGGECNKARNGGSNPHAQEVMQPAFGPTAVGPDSPYTAGLVSHRPIS